MATTKQHRNTRNHADGSRTHVEKETQVTQQALDYLIEYARENPGYAALWCLGVGFVLGWKVKPW